MTKTVSLESVNPIPGYIYKINNSMWVKCVGFGENTSSYKCITPDGFLLYLTEVNDFVKILPFTKDAAIYKWLKTQFKEIQAND